MKRNEYGVMAFEEGETVHLERVHEGKMTVDDIAYIEADRTFQSVSKWAGSKIDGHRMYRVCDTGEAYTLTAVRACGTTFEFNIIDREGNRV